MSTSTEENREHGLSAGAGSGRRPPGVLSVAMFAALAAYAAHGWYARYIRDDYCTAISVRDRGIVGSWLFFHETWSGRFSYYLVKGVLETIGPVTVHVVPLLLILGLAFASIFATRSRLAGIALTFATIAAAPDVLAWGGSLIWETGSITYMLPVILYMVWLGFVREPSRRRALAGAAIMLFAGGFSETSLAAQGMLAGGLLVWFAIERDRVRAAVAGWGLAGSIVALAILGTAPGNRVRLASNPTPPPVIDAITSGLKYAYGYLGSHVFVDGEALLIVMAVAALMGATNARIEPRTAIAGGFITLTAYLATFLPAAWSLSSSPPARAMLVSTWCLALMLACFAAAFGRRFAGITRYDTPLLLLLAIIPVLTAVEIVQRMPQARFEAVEIDRVTAALQANRGDVTARSRWAHSMSFASDDPSDWMNQCLCSFYGARSLRVER